jgi:hypothetical protein
MSKDTKIALSALISTVAEHTQADFYSQIWADARNFNELPTVSRSDVRMVPLSQRLYTEGPGMARMITDSEGMFGYQYSFEELNKEIYGPVGVRPLVCFADAHDAIEKSLWCYAHGTVPLIGEKDPTITALVAKEYRINSLLADEASFESLREHLQQHIQPISSVMLFGKTFQHDVLAHVSALARDVRFLLSLPEVGAFASALPESVPQFTVLPGCIVESDGELIITKLALRAFPVIRYRTGIQAPAFVGIRKEGDML